MSRLLCCVGGEEGDRGGKARGPGSVKESDYLLPGGEWDPSISSSPLRTVAHHHGPAARSDSTASDRTTSSSVRSFLSKRFRRKSRHSETSNRANSVADNNGGYLPPPLVPSKTLPTIDEFKLLKTVGRGAFGKVG